MKTVVFDLDGTLADTSGDLIAAANACFEALGHGALLDAETDKLTAFHGAKAMLRLGFSRLERATFEVDVEMEYPKLLDHYGEHIDVHTQLYPGAEAAVERLLSAGYATAICTNKSEGLAETLMQKLGVRGLFGPLVGSDTLPTRKPDIAPYVACVERAGGVLETSILIGDTETDVKTARAAEVPVVLVGFGPEGPGISRLIPDAMLNRYEDLDGVVEVLLK